MGFGKRFSEWLDRRLSGGTMEDYQTAEAETAADFDLLHEDEELEARLPRSSLGRGLATWSFRPGPTASSFSKSTKFFETSDRALHESVLAIIGRTWADISVAATCRTTPEDPLHNCVKATRYRGADEATLRGALVPPASGQLEIGGVVVERVDRVRVRLTPALETEGDGYRLTRGDVVFEMATDFETDAEAWLADLVEQIVNGWRHPAPTFAVDLPASWIGLPASRANIAKIADLDDAGRPSKAEGPPAGLLPDPAMTYLAVDLAPGSTARVFVDEFKSWPVPFEQEMDEWQREWAEKMGHVSLEYVAVPVGSAGRLGFEFGDADRPLFGQPYIVRVGERSYRLDFGTTVERRDQDAPVFESIIRSLRPITS